MCCQEIRAIMPFHLKFKARLSWNTTILKIFTVEFNCVGNHFLKEFFSEILKNHFLDLVSTFLK